MLGFDLREWFISTFLPNITAPPSWAQALNVVGEAGEFAEAYRRYTGNARRTSDKAEVAAELADVIISAYGFAALEDIDLDAAIVDKVKVVMSRGFGNQAVARGGPPYGSGPCHCDGSGHNRGHVFKGYLCKSDVHVPCPDHEVRP